MNLIHSEIIDRLLGDTFNIKSVHSLANQNLSALQPPEFLNSINLSGELPHKMTLKVNTPIMLL